ncbi:hypothetical protein M5K25_009119 [Dendrobium thyrsiflorum]|uniref:Uncharacterized protein n=1 Tax=Dendrobium thyrsiflorum TaxID=117978 RepID=A0ABD0V5Y9_DENTH
MERRSIAKSSKGKSTAAAAAAAVTFKGASQCEEDRELKSWEDAGEEGGEEEMDFCHESVRKKMGVLAKLVGMEGCGGQPAVVLTEVVRVLKELDGQARVVCGSTKPSF